jgi:hypothetical protein
MWASAVQLSHSQALSEIYWKGEKETLPHNTCVLNGYAVIFEDTLLELESREQKVSVF